MGQQSRRTLLWSMIGYPYDRCFILGHFFELMQNKLYFFTKINCIFLQKKEKNGVHSSPEEDFHCITPDWGVFSKFLGY